VHTKSTQSCTGSMPCVAKYYVATAGQHSRGTNTSADLQFSPAAAAPRYLRPAAALLWPAPALLPAQLAGLRVWCLGCRWRAPGQRGWSHPLPPPVDGCHCCWWPAALPLAACCLPRCRCWLRPALLNAGRAAHCRRPPPRKVPAVGWVLGPPRPRHHPIHLLGCWALLPGVPVSCGRRIVRCRWHYKQQNGMDKQQALHIHSNTSHNKGATGPAVAVRVPGCRGTPWSSYRSGLD
jgi:hypothetical protein